MVVCRLLEEWSYGWTYSGYFDYAVGWLGGRIVGRGEVVGVWVVAECRSGDGRVTNWSYKGVKTNSFVHIAGRTTKSSGGS